MPSETANFGKTLMMTSHNPPPEGSGGFCFRNSSNIIKAGHTSPEPTADPPPPPPPPPPENPGKLGLRGPSDPRSSSDFTTSGNPYVVTRSSSPSVAKSGKLWFSSTNFTKSGNLSAEESENL
jgi:hypothetical protein